MSFVSNRLCLRKRVYIVSLQYRYVDDIQDAVTNNEFFICLENTHFKSS